MSQNNSLARQLVERAFGSHRFNDSVFYQWYLRVRHPKSYQARLLEREFYHKLISQAGTSLVIDVGANGGNKTFIFAEIADRVLCVEPSPAAVNILQERFAQSENITVVGKGVGAQVGSCSFHIFGETDCYNTFSSKWATSLAASDRSNQLVKKAISVIDVPITTLDALIEQFGIPAYIKIDVEGFELEVLKGLSQPVNLISIECNLPQFESETLECLTRLEEIQPTAVFNYCISEPPVKLALDRWISRSDLARIVEQGDYQFMEIYMRSS
jgi:FkbM family methyltransferase